MKINDPILTNTDMLKIKTMKVDGFRVAVSPLPYYKSTPLERAIDRLFVEVDKAYRQGANILVLSDRGVDENHVPMPSLLAVSAVHQHLVKTKKRTSLAIILESGEPRDVHHFAALLGYGASAVNPYLALDTIHELVDSGMLEKDYYAAVSDYTHAVLSGIVKIASKMGISTIQSYQGAQIFEAIGISQEVIDKYFTGTCQPGGGHYHWRISPGMWTSGIRRPLIPWDSPQILPWTVWDATRAAARGRSTGTIRRPSICCRSPPAGGITKCSRSTPDW